MATAKDAAKWMYEEVKSTGELYQADAVDYITEHFGEEHIYENENGNPAISREVLSEFKNLHGGKAVWDRSSFLWEWN